MAALTLRKVVKRFGHVEIIHGVDLGILERLGDITYLHGLTQAGNRLTVSITGFHGFKHGDSTGFDFDAKDLHLFDSQEKALIV
jgi:ABC-type sugar transport system ATPase subunit